jgi:hypothetical protein
MCDTLAMYITYYQSLTQLSHMLQPPSLYHCLLLFKLDSPLKFETNLGVNAKHADLTPFLYISIQDQVLESP